MKSTPTKQKTIQREWHLVDLSDISVGRAAARIARLLRGKSKPYFVPHLDCGDYVVVINAAHIKVTGKKKEQKVYTRYSGYPSGLKTETLGGLLARRPEEVVRRAVSGMLPKNKLRKHWLKRLLVFRNKEHTHQDKFNPASS